MQSGLFHSNCWIEILSFWRSVSYVEFTYHVVIFRHKATPDILFSLYKNSLMLVLEDGLFKIIKS